MAKSGKVLVVDDYAPNLCGLGQLLERADYTVLTATNGRTRSRSSGTSGRTSCCSTSSCPECPDSRCVPS